MHKSVEEFSVKLLEFGGLGAALQALHLPFGKEVDSTVRSDVDNPMEIDRELRYNTHLLLSKKDQHLISTLVRRGDEHAKVLRGVCV
jgi:hypothetical protein